MSTRSEKLRKRQRRKEKKRARTGWAPELAPRGEVPTVVVTPPGEVGMSDVLAAFVAPQMHRCKNEDSVRMLLSLGAIAWNCALLPAEERTKSIENALDIVPEEGRDDMRVVLDEFIRRKELVFPHITRLILNFDLVRIPSGKTHLAVTSGMVA